MGRKETSQFQVKNRLTKLRINLSIYDWCAVQLLSRFKLKLD